MLLLAADPDVSAEIADVAWKAAVGIGLAQLAAGALILVAWYAVQKRFLSHEYPGDLQRITGQISHLESAMRADVSSIRADIASLRGELATSGIKLVEHSVTLGEHGRRLGRVEDRIERRAEDLDDTRGTPRRR